MRPTEVAAPGNGRRQFLLLLATLAVTQTGLQAARPLISYRTIALGGGGVEVGLGATAFALLSVLIALPLGRFTDRTGRTLTLLLVGTLTCVAAIGVLAAAPTVLAVAASSTLLGFAHVLLMTGAQGQVARVSADSRLDANFGWMAAAVSAGQLLGPLLTGFSLGQEQVSAETSAQAAVLAAGVSLAAVPLAILLALCGRAAGTAVPKRPAGPAGTGTIELLRRPGILPALLTSLSLLAAVDILTAYLPLVGQERNIGATSVGAILAARAAASLASRIGLGRISARFRHATLVTASTIGSGVALAVLALPTDNVVILGLASVIAGLLLGLGQPLTMTLVVRAVPASARGTALALRLVFNRIGQVVLPAMAALGTGFLGASAALWFASGVLVFSGFLPQAARGESVSPDAAPGEPAS